MTVFSGSNQSDYFQGTDLADTLEGFGGEDFLYAGAGDDLLRGGAGPDWLGGDGGDDTLQGGAGDDQLDGGEGADLVFGGEGRDLLTTGEAQDDTLHGGQGQDMLSFGDSAFDWNDDTGISIDLRNLAASSAEVPSLVFSGIEAFGGTQQNDLMLGTDQSNAFFGAYGNDTLRGFKGNDLLYAGAAVDFRFYAQDTEFQSFDFDGPSLEADTDMVDRPAPTGGDLLVGGGGDDTLIGDGDGHLIGGLGNDTITGRNLNGHSTLDGGAGHDFIEAGGATVLGGSGRDTIYDSYGHDEIFAGRGNDLVVMDELHSFADDADHVDLGAGRDAVFLRTNRDADHDTRTFDGGAGFDTLYINWMPGLVNFDTGRRVIDFRSQETGDWLDMGDIKVRNFERVFYEATSKVQAVHFGNRADVLSMTLSNYDEFFAYGHGGDDVLFCGANNSQVFGGKGDDRLIANGGADGGSTFRGQAGDDILFARFDNADYSDGHRLIGGAGSDGFVFQAAGAILNQTGRTKVQDFDVDEDWIGLNLYDRRGPYGEVDYGEIIADPETSTRRALDADFISDTDKKLVFAMEVLGYYGGESEKITFTYNRKSGVLSGQRDSDAFLGDRDVLAKFSGAPDLTMDHFFGMTTLNEDALLL